MASNELEDADVKAVNEIEIHFNVTEERFLRACECGEVDTARTILEESTEQQAIALVKGVRCTGSVLFEAVLSQQRTVVQFLLSTPYVDIEQECQIKIFYPVFIKDTCTVLCLACACCDVELVQLLLDHGASVNHPSLYSSPLIYASEYNNVKLMSLLLSHGATLDVTPVGLSTTAALLPIFHACLYGHKETAQLLLCESQLWVPPEKKITLLGLLGAQCIHKNDDQENAVKFWKLALQEAETLQELDPMGSKADQAARTSCGQGASPSLVEKLQLLYLQHSHENCPHVDLSNSNVDAKKLFHHRPEVFEGMQICSSVTELEAIADNSNALQMQALLLLENILGPSHPETTQQISRTARVALGNGDLAQTSQLFLYIIESNCNREQVSVAVDYMTQLIDLLLNVFRSSNNGGNLQLFDNFASLLVTALHICQEMLNMLFSQAALKESTLVFRETKFRHVTSPIIQLTEMIEIFMGLLRILVEQDITQSHWKKTQGIMMSVLKLSRDAKNLDYHKHHLDMEFEMLKITVHGGHSTQAALYVFQEDLFPNQKVLDFLLLCGADPNCRDHLGDTPLLCSVDCIQPSKEIVCALLDSGAHVDIMNWRGSSAYDHLLRQPQFGINAFQLRTLKCLAASAIMFHKIPFVGQVPQCLQAFIPWHGFQRTPRLENSCHKSMSLENIRMACSR